MERKKRVVPREICAVSSESLLMISQATFDDYVQAEMEVTQKDRRNGGPKKEMCIYQSDDCICLRRHSFTFP